MTLEIAFLLSLLTVMAALFMSELLPVELTAFLGLLVLIFTGYVDTGAAFSGFASPAVITMFSIFFVSAALLETGVADAVGGWIHAWVGAREVPLLVVIMAVAGTMSAFMNNVAATAVLLPAVASIARRARLAPSRLFIPLAFGSILGGTTTLVGTPPNILTAEVLVERGIPPFSLFSFTPIGLALVAVGILFMATWGRRLLPARMPPAEGEDAALLTRAYRLEERLTSIRVPPGSQLEGKSLREARLGEALDVKVVGVLRGGRKSLAPPPDYRLEGGDHLLVEGRFGRLQELLGVQGLAVEEPGPGLLSEAGEQARGAVLGLPSGSGLVGRTLRELRFRHRYGVLVVGIVRPEGVLRARLASEVLRPGDELLVLAGRRQLERLAGQSGLEMRGPERLGRELLGEGLFVIQVPAGSSLAGKSVGESRMGELVGLTVIGILRRGETLLAVSPDEAIEAGDELLVAGEPNRILDLMRLSDLELQEEPPGARLESERVGVAEVVVAPRSKVAGATLRELRFRERYGLQVLALWRAGAPIHRRLADLPLSFGDALLLQGPWEKIRLLAEGSDFLVLSQAGEAPRRKGKAPIALGALGVMVALVVSGLYPIHVAAFAAASLTVLFGALKMEEAYRAIEWRAIFLVAAVLPVGMAMEKSGAALFLAELTSEVGARFGPHAFLAVLVVLSSALSQALDGAPTVVIMAPVVLLTAEQLGLSPYPLMMATGLAASAAFLTPFSHKANLLVMSAGGYRPFDYFKVGAPLTVAVFVILVLLVPVLFPF